MDEKKICDTANQAQIEAVGFLSQPVPLWVVIVAIVAVTAVAVLF